MQLRPRAIIFGAELLAQALGAERIVIAVEDPLADTHGSLAALLTSCAQQRAQPTCDMAVATVPQRFPQGAEGPLIQTLTGQQVPHTGLPQDLGLLVANVATAAASFDAIVHQRPVTHRLVTVTGPGVVAPMNVHAPIGLAVSELIDVAGGGTANCSRWIMGGPVSGQAISDLSVRVDKGSLCVLGLTQAITDTPQPTLPCINCGFCVDVCPSRLLPQQLFKLAQNGQHDKAQQLGMTDCIECGLCAEVCPSHLPLLETYRHSKDRLKVQNMDERAQQLAKRRHDARQQRIEKEDAAHQARRQARAERLQSQTAAQSEIEAALARARAKKNNAGGEPPSEDSSA
jgi:electron transport complex protein RnfC